MLGILLIYFIGKWFYKLADKYEQNRWVYAILSVVVFFAFQFFIGIIFTVLMPEFMSYSNRFFYNIVITVLAGLGIYGVYILLEKNWKKNAPKPHDEIDKLGKE